MKRLAKIIGVVFLVVMVLSTLLLLSHKALYSNSVNDNPHSLIVLTYNTQRMGMFRKPQHNEVIKYLQQTEADVVCLQEVEVYKDKQYLTLQELKNAFARYPYSYIDFKVYNKRLQFGNVVFSRYPLINKHTIRYTSKGNISSCCDMVVNGDTLRLITNHLESYRFSQNDIEEFLSHPNPQPIKERVLPSTRIRWRQARLVNREVEQSPYPIVLVGDFNAIPLSLTYLILRQHLKDAFLSTSNLRIGSTYTKRKWGIRIDYILHSPDLVATECQVDKTSGSDHYPICATLVW